MGWGSCRYDAGKFEFFAPASALFGVQFFLMSWVELRRLQVHTSPTSWKFQYSKTFSGCSLNLVFYEFTISGISFIMIYFIMRMNALEAHTFIRCNSALLGSTSCCAGHEDTWLHKCGPHLHQQQTARQQLTRVWIIATLKHVEVSNYLEHCHWSRTN